MKIKERFMKLTSKEAIQMLEEERKKQMNVG